MNKKSFKEFKFLYINGDLLKKFLYFYKKNVISLDYFYYYSIIEEGLYKLNVI